MHKKKALFLHELRRSWWICLVGVIMALMGVFIVWESVAANLWQYDDIYSMLETMNIPVGNIPVGSLFSAALVQTIQIGHHVLVIAIAVMMLIVYLDSHNRKNEEYIQCLPYTRTQRFFTKTLLMYAYITITCLVFSGGVIAVRQANIDKIKYNSLLSPVYEGLLANETIWHTLRSLVLFWIIIMTLYTVFLMVHSLVNSSAMASLMTVGVITAPKVLVWTINQFYIIFTGKNLMNYGSLSGLSDIFWGNATYVGAEGGNPMSVYDKVCYITDYNFSTYVISYENMLLQACLMAVIFVAALLIAWHANKRYDLAKDRRLVSATWARYAFAIGAGLCTGAGIAVVVGNVAREVQQAEYSLSAGITGLSALLLAGGGFSILYYLLFRIKVKN